MSLKTLKDIEFKWVLTDKKNSAYQEVVDKEELKQEAIKWLKHGKKGLERAKESPYNEQQIWHCMGWNKFVEEFFNITEEDLI